MLIRLYRLQRLANSRTRQSKRARGVSQQTSGWDYFTGRLQRLTSKPRKTKVDGYR